MSQSKYKVLSYIPAEPEEEEFYESEKEAMEELEHRILLNPQNYHEIVEVEECSDDEPNNRTNNHKDE